MAFHQTERGTDEMRIGGRQIRVSILFKMFAVFFIMLAAFACWYGYLVLPRFQADKIQDAEDRTKNAVELAWGALGFVHQMEQAGMMTTDQAQAYALVAVGSLSWDTGDGEGFFWVNDSRPVLLVDARNPGMVNTNVSTVADQDGNLIYQHFVSIARNEGEGAYRYRLANATQMSYVKSFEPWGWVVGTNGSDLQTLIAEYRSWRDAMGWMLGGILFCFLFIFWMVVRTTVSKPLASMVKTSEALAEGDVNNQIDVRSGDEVGDLAAAYSRVIDYMKEMAEATSRVADGDLTIDARPRSDRDVLGHAHSRLVARQRDLIGKTKSAAANVAEASKQLTKASEQTAQATQQITATIQTVARGANEQSISLQQTTQGVDQLTTAIRQIAEGSRVQARGSRKRRGW